MNLIASEAFIVSAMLEVAGDAVVRRGLRGDGFPFIIAGCAAPAGYGVMVNPVRWDFSRLMGVYLGFFALTGMLAGRFVINTPIASFLEMNPAVNVLK